jgi:hypothetical protein
MPLFLYAIIAGIVGIIGFFITIAEKYHAYRNKNGIKNKGPLSQRFYR